MKSEQVNQFLHLLQKYRDVHPAALMDEITERIAALLAKLSLLTGDDAETHALESTFLTWLDDMVARLTRAQSTFAEDTTTRDDIETMIHDLQAMQRELLAQQGGCSEEYFVIEDVIMTLKEKLSHHIPHRG